MAIKKCIYLFLALTLCHTAHPSIAHCARKLSIVKYIPSAVELRMFKNQNRIILHQILRKQPDDSINPKSDDSINPKSVLYMLQQNNVHPNDQDEQGNTALHVVINDAYTFEEPIDLYVVHLLLLYGANPKKLNHKGKSPIDLASEEIPNKKDFLDLIQKIKNNPDYL